jgi:hypothetical protein
VQTKLNVSRLGDSLGREADETAGDVIQGMSYRGNLNHSDRTNRKTRENAITHEARVFRKFPPHSKEWQANSVRSQNREQ